jgi:hypothetical protein
MADNGWRHTARDRPEYLAAFRHRLAFKEGWKRIPGNDGHARVAVPMSAIVPREMAPHRFWLQNVQSAGVAYHTGDPSPTRRCNSHAESDKRQFEEAV